ncbi:MAG: tetratricopeptide repeat protein [Planctomycetota bacterium]|nr:tetratricopeptide repeat protein [Planctomycetota bacterium]
MQHRLTTHARRLARLALLAAALALPACNKTIRMGVPPGVTADEARRLMNAERLSLEASKLETSDRPAAIDKYKQAVLEYREYTQAWNNLGRLLMEEGQYLQAAEAFSTAADLSPEDPRPCYNLGLLYDRRGYLREARDYYERAIDRESNYLPALRGAIRADALLNEGSTQTLDWLARALMLERDARWLEWMRLQKARIENLPTIRALTGI